MTTALLVAALAAALMGLAIQRGGTCTVAAVDEWVASGRVNRLSAMLEASLWVAGGLAVASLFTVPGSMPVAPRVDGWTIAGGVLLGLGAWLNGACVFGAIARLGSGQWAYALTPLGFYLGCASVAVWSARGVVPAGEVSPVIAGAAFAAPLFAAYALWRSLPAWRVGVRRWLRGPWTPHAATIGIGITFVVTWLLAGRWAYTDLLADLARQGVAPEPGWRGVLFAALLGGAVLGGWLTGRWRAEPVTAVAALRCLAGGAVMAWGSLLVPGSNDGLVLAGLPLLQPHAWLAFATMCVSIAAALQVQRAWRGRQREPRVSG